MIDRSGLNRAAIQVLGMVSAIQKENVYFCVVLYLRCIEGEKYSGKPGGRVTWHNILLHHPLKGLILSPSCKESKRSFIIDLWSS